MAKELWEIKYRPQKVEDYIFQNSKHAEVVQKFIDEKYIPHLLLNGHRGTGKTSLAIVLKNELGIDDMDFMTINASDENNVDTMRNKIKNFISTYSISPFKLVLLDEADYLSVQAQALLRNMMEEYADNARFILSCNRGNKIIPELKSRCFEIPFTKMDKNDMMERLAVILATEKIKATLPLLSQYVELAYPDMRKAVQLLQNNCLDGKLQEPSEVDDNLEASLRIVALMESGDYLAIRELLATDVTDDDWERLYTFIYTYLHEIGKFEDSKKWKAGIVVIADHLYKHSMVADPEINAMAMFIKLGDI